MDSPSDEAVSQDEDFRPEDPAKTVEMGKVFLEKVVHYLGVEGWVEVEDTEEHILYRIHSDGQGLLIGRYGQTLDAIQYLMARVVNKDHRQWRRVIVDTEGYRERRAEVLKRMALRLGDKAKKTRRPVELDDMNPHDRRIVHITLQDDPDLYTESMGDDYNKYVVIYPAAGEEYPDDGVAEPYEQDLDAVDEPLADPGPAEEEEEEIETA